MAMMAMTTSSSMSVNPTSLCDFKFGFKCVLVVRSAASAIWGLCGSLLHKPCQLLAGVPQLPFRDTDLFGVRMQYSGSEHRGLGFGLLRASYLYGEVFCAKHRNRRSVDTGLGGNGTRGGGRGDVLCFRLLGWRCAAHLRSFCFV